MRGLLHRGHRIPFSTLKARLSGNLYDTDYPKTSLNGLSSFLNNTEPCCDDDESVLGELTRHCVRYHSDLYMTKRSVCFFHDHYRTPSV